MKNLDRYLVLALFSGCVIKSLVLGVSLPESIVILTLAGATFFYSKEMQHKEMKELKEKFNDLSAKQFDQSNIISELRTSITGVKLTQNLRNVNKP